MLDPRTKDEEIASFVKRRRLEVGKKVRTVHGFFSSQSFWNAGSLRKGSQRGSILKKAGVITFG